MTSGLRGSTVFFGALLITLATGTVWLGQPVGALWSKPPFTSELRRVYERREKALKKKDEDGKVVTLFEREARSSTKRHAGRETSPSRVSFGL